MSHFPPRLAASDRVCRAPVTSGNSAVPSVLSASMSMATTSTRLRLSWLEDRRTAIDQLQTIRLDD